jgi:hypothetical protein
MCIAPGSFHPYHWRRGDTRASGLWQGTRTGAGGTASLKHILAATHGSMDNKSLPCVIFKAIMNLTNVFTTYVVVALLVNI